MCHWTLKDSVWKIYVNNIKTENNYKITGLWIGEISMIKYELHKKWINGKCHDFSESIIHHYFFVHSAISAAPNKNVHTFLITVKMKCAKNPYNTIKIPSPYKLI